LAHVVEGFGNSHITRLRTFDDLNQQHLFNR
jgi:hypothetical protein